MPRNDRTIRSIVWLCPWRSTMLVFANRVYRKRRVRAWSFKKNPHLYIYMLTTMLTVATKMIIQILPDSWILRVAWNTVDPYTLPASHHIFFRSNGIRKCDRNIKYSRAALGFKFWNSRGLWRPIFCQFHLRSRASIEIFVLDIHNIFLLGEQLSLRWIQTISYL